MIKQKLIYLLPHFLLSSCSHQTYKSTSLSPDERANLLLQELTLEEKVMLMMDSSKPIERLGIKPYNWWNEALHGVARAGLATVFPQPIGMAASFAPNDVLEVFTAVSDEARAKNTYYTSKGSYEDTRTNHVGHHQLTSIGILVGERIETYGEDPILPVKGCYGS